MFCKHQWKLLNEVKHPCRLAVARSLGVTPSRGSSEDLIEKVRSDYTCTKCGKFKTVVTSNR